MQLLLPVAGLSSGGYFTQETPGLSLRSIRNVSVTEGSDLILCQNFAIFDKATRRTSEKCIFHDSNLANIDLSLKTVDVIETSPLASFVRAYSMLGVFAAHWGHFVLERLLGLSTILPYLPDDAVILVPDTIDPVQRELLVSRLAASRKSNKICLIPEKQTISVAELYYSNLPVILSNDGRWISIFDTSVQYFAQHEMRRIVGEVSLPSNGPRKVFFTRGASRARGIENIREIEEYYEARGYYIFNPDGYTYSERQVGLGAVEEAAGVYGSAYLNLMFCPKLRRVSTIAPLVRTMDGVCANLFSPSEWVIHLAHAKDQSPHPAMFFDLSLLDAGDRL